MAVVVVVVAAAAAGVVVVVVAAAAAAGVVVVVAAAAAVVVVVVNFGLSPLPGFQSQMKVGRLGFPPSNPGIGAQDSMAFQVLRSSNKKRPGIPRDPNGC